LQIERCHAKEVIETGFVEDELDDLVDVDVDGVAASLYEILDDL
jgi:hypothetical protein